MKKHIKKAVFSKYLNEDEVIINSAHNHIMSISKEIAIDFIVWLFVPGFLAYNNIFTPYVYYIFLGSAFAIFYHFYDWYADAFIITNKGVINVEWNGFFDRSSQRINYGDIITVNIEQKGFFATIFNYGHLILTCSDGSTLCITNAINPEHAQSQIAKQKELLTISERSREGLSNDEIKMVINNIKDEESETKKVPQFKRFEIADEEE